jgi:hypothetical protein
MALHDEPGLTLAARQLDPATRMGELLFGLIMTLTFTLGAGVLVRERGQEGARQLLMRPPVATLRGVSSTACSTCSANCSNAAVDTA